MLAVADDLPDHLLVQAGVLPEPLGHLVVVHGAAEQTVVLQELDPLFRLLVELLRAGDQELEADQPLMSRPMLTQCKDHAHALTQS